MIHNRDSNCCSFFLQVAGERLSYLLDVYFFTQEDIDWNSQVMLWPEKIRPIFEQSEAVSLLTLESFAKTVTATPGTFYSSLKLTGCCV